MQNEHLISVDPELMEIIREIKQFNFGKDQWEQIPSCDQFQSDSYCGGYEDGCFTFSKYVDGIEHLWISIPYEYIEQIINGTITTVLAYDPE